MYRTFYAADAFNSALELEPGTTSRGDTTMYVKGTFNNAEAFNSRSTGTRAR